MLDTMHRAESSKSGDVEKADTGTSSEFPSTGAGSSPETSSDESGTSWRSVTSRCLEGANQRIEIGGSLMPRFLIDVLNSTSQVVFVTNSVSGALILLAMLLGAPRGASVLGALGALCATGISWLLSLDREAREEGLLGYNAVLVGAGFAVFVDNFLLALLGTVVFATLSALLAAGLSRLVKPHLTLSFNVCILSGLALIHLAQLEHVVPGHHGKAKEAIFEWISDFRLLDGLDCLKAALNGVSQIFLVTSPLSGVIILVAICLVTPLGALCSLWASLLATLLAALCGVPLKQLEHGIWGFNAALTSLWVALHFRSLGHWWVLLLVTLASAVATGTFGLLEELSRFSGGWMAASFTLPFNAVAFFLVAMERCVLRPMCTKQRPCTEEHTTP